MTADQFDSLYMLGLIAGLFVVFWLAAIQGGQR